MEHPIKMDDLGVPLFLETPISRVMIWFDPFFFFVDEFDEVSTVQWASDIFPRQILEDSDFRIDSRFTTLPETNIAGWKIHHFDGIYKERWDFHGLC